MSTIKVGMLALQGDVEEHVEATKKAAEKLKICIEIIPVRTKDDLRGLEALIIPGGESTTLQKLCEREGLFEEIKKIKNIFGTCAGAILLAKNVRSKEKDQRTLEIMDIEVDRNAYGRQSESFEEQIETQFGTVNAIFIGAPRILDFGKSVTALAENRNGILACEQIVGDAHYMAVSFHPELTTTLFHEHFLRQL